MDVVEGGTESMESPRSGVSIDVEGAAIEPVGYTVVAGYVMGNKSRRVGFVNKWTAREGADI